MQVRRRHVIFLQGYDPRGLGAYYRMFRGELRKFGALYGLASRISRPTTTPDGLISSWSITTEDDGWQTHTHYDFLRWEDLVQRDRALSAWRTIIQSIAIYGWLTASGVLWRFIKANWRFAAFISYPYVALLGAIALAAGCGYGAYAALGALGSPGAINISGAGALSLAVLAVLVVKGESRSYMLYLMADTIFTYQFAHGRRPDWDERIDHFARYLADVAAVSDADELIVAGHSSGSFLGTELMARAQALDPALGRHGPRVSLMTVGGNLPIVGFLPVAASFRDNLRKLAITPDIDWFDCQSRKDVMNFFAFDPIAGHRIDTGGAQRNPTLVSVRLRDMIAPDRYNAFRWRFFSVHFQFVMANDRANFYDFFMIVCGPVPLAARMACPDQALAIATGDAPAREAAWRSLKSFPAARPGGRSQSG